MKLWVDDMRDAPDESWTEVRKVQPAITLLSNFHFEEISLDHDIENRPDDETFKPIAHYIGMKYDQRVLRDIVKPIPPKITIHSINPTGSKEIQDILLSYGLYSTRAPYAKDLEKMEKEFGVSGKFDGEE